MQRIIYFICTILVWSLGMNLGASANETEIDENALMANHYTYIGYDLLEQGDLNNAAKNLEISLQYIKDPEIMYDLAEIYKDNQITDGGGCRFMWNFDRAQDLYTEVFCMTGDSSPMVSFCKMCDDVLIDPTIRDGYKLQILENYDIKARFDVNDELAPGEYRYFAEFDQEGYKLLIEGGEFDDYFRTYGYME